MPEPEPDFLPKRQFERRRRLLKARMRHPRHGEIDILIRDVSELGIGGRCDRDLTIGEHVVILLPDSEPAEGRVAWRRGQAFGVQLGDSIDPANVKSPPATERPVTSAYQVPSNFRPTIDTKRPGFRTRTPGLETHFKLD